jgi:hypothetical protein
MNVCVPQTQGGLCDAHHRMQAGPNDPGSQEFEFPSDHSHRISYMERNQRSHQWHVARKLSQVDTLWDTELEDLTLEKRILLMLLVTEHLRR